MDAKGYELITGALGEAVPATVTPQPVGTEHVRFVTVEFSQDTAPAIVLNALGSVGLAHRGVARTMSINHDPNLHVVGMMPGSITFEDTNTRR